MEKIEEILINIKVKIIELENQLNNYSINNKELEEQLTSLEKKLIQTVDSISNKSDLINEINLDNYDNLKKSNRNDIYEHKKNYDVNSFIDKSTQLKKQEKEGEGDFLKEKKTPQSNKITIKYSDKELDEFREIIKRKLIPVREEYNRLIKEIESFELIEKTRTNNLISKIQKFKYETKKDQKLEEKISEIDFLKQSAARLSKFIENLENALLRIENKTYGICRVTGKLIAKERLRAVPHTTLSMEAKLLQYK